MLPGNLKFSCSALPTTNGHSVKGLTPDSNGCYDVVLGCVGAPTRANVIYESQSLIRAMDDINSRFNICLKDGNLFGEWGHPVIKGKEDIPRLMRIDEKYISHVFNKIWVDDTPIILHGKEGYPIRALVKPCGPYGEVLEKSLRDPMINTAFSIRSLCLPGTGPDPKYEYRVVQMVVTFDAVNAPGFEMATKRYNSASMESFECNIERRDLDNVITTNSGMESSMLTDNDIHKLFNDTPVTIGGKIVASGIKGKCIINSEGKLSSPASILYGRK